MTIRAWLFTACGLVAAVSNAAAEESPFRSSDTGSSDSARTRAGEYFTRGPRPGTSTGTATLSQTGVRARSKTPEFEEAEIPFGSTADEPTVDQTFQRLRLKSRAVTEKPKLTPVSSEEIDSDELTPPGRSSARTPSGARLSRSMSSEEELSGIIHANHETPASASGSRIEKVAAQKKFDDAENPFASPEELKGDPSSQKRNAAKPPETVAKPETRPAARPETRTIESAKLLEKKPAESKGAENPFAETKPAAKPVGNVSEIRGTPSRPSLSAKKDPKGTITRTAHVDTGDSAATTLATLETSLSEELSLDGPQTPLVTTRWVKRSEINVGQECECDLVVKNTGSVAANEVVVEAHFPKSVRLTNSKPEPSQGSDHLAWTFATLAPGEEQSIRIRMIPSRKGELAATANVRFTGSSSSVFQVDEPMLALALKGAKEVLVGDPASHIITISNPGSGVAQNVVVEALIPKGLEHPRGEKLQMEVGSLGAGESRTIRLALAAVSGGQCTVHVSARADANLSQVATSDVLVVAPSVKLTMEGPSLRFVGRTATYVLSAYNDGAAPSNNVRVMHKIPDGFKYVKADKGGKYDETNQTVSWFVGRLEPGQTIPVKVELAPVKLGTYVHQAGAVSEQGARSEARLETVVDGASALQIEIVEQADPVEVGGETVYEVRVKNSGSKAATSVGISCELASGIQVLSAKGPTEFVSENSTLVFKSLPTLPAGKTATYRVAVKATVEGNHRFRVRLASQSITEPLISEELTRFYSE